MAKTPRSSKEAQSENKKGGAPSKAETALRKKRSQRSFPASTFEEPLEFAAAVFRIGSGQAVKRLTLFDQLGKSPESSGSRQLIINSGATVSHEAVCRRKISSLRLRDRRRLMNK
jgi:hypothetical protein